MDIIQKGIITLIKSAVTQQSLVLPEGFSVEEAYPQIRRHSLIALAYDGAVRCGISRQEPMMQKLFQGYVRSMQISEGQMRQVARICKAFDENGIDYMPLKGVNMKKLYPAPELRAMGDADILIRVEQYERVAPIMEKLGYVAGVETECERIWDHSELHLELHARLVSQQHKDFYPYLGDGWRLAKLSEGTCYKIEPEDEFIYELIHFSKHFRNGGIGFRHVTDLWLYQRKHPEMDREYLRRELLKLGLLEFYGNIQKLIDAWFEDGELDELADFLTGFITASGNWGNAEEHLLSELLRKEREKAVRTTRLGYVFEQLFPPTEALRNKYTVLKHAPWLLPVVWVYRPIYKLMFERESLLRQAGKVKLATKEKVDGKREMLRYVGLDFNFS